MIHSPPTRRWHSDSTTQSAPPALIARCASGSVYASNTTSGGASNHRWRRMSGSRASPRPSRDVAVEPVEPPFPHAKRLDPLPSFVEAFWAERALPDPAHLLGRQQSRLLEDAHVFQDRGKGDPEGSCQLADRRRARGDELQDAAAGRVGQRVERPVERRILRHVANRMQPHRAGQLGVSEGRERGEHHHERLALAVDLDGLLQWHHPAWPPGQARTAAEGGTGAWCLPCYSR